jgi:hypothetical protein
MMVEWGLACIGAVYLSFCALQTVISVFYYFECLELERKSNIRGIKELLKSQAYDAERLSRLESVVGKLNGKGKK